MTTETPAAELRAAAVRLRDVAPMIDGPLAGLADPVAEWLDVTAAEPVAAEHSDRCAEPGCTINTALVVARRILGTTEQADTVTAPADRRDRYAAAIREADGWVLDDGQHMIDAVMVVADTELAELRTELERRTLMLRASREQVTMLKAIGEAEHRAVRRADANLIRRLGAETQQRTEIERTLGHADDGEWHDVTGQPEPTLTASQFTAGLLHTLNSPTGDEEPEDEAQQPTPDVAEETKPEVRMCPAKHGAWGRICDQRDGHPGFHSGRIPNGSVTWEGDAP